MRSRPRCRFPGGLPQGGGEPDQGGADRDVQGAGECGVGQAGQEREEGQHGRVRPGRHPWKHPGPDQGRPEQRAAHGEDGRGAEERGDRRARQGLLDDRIVEVEQHEVRGERGAAEQAEPDEADDVGRLPEATAGRALALVQRGQQRQRERGGQGEEEAGRRGLPGEDFDERGQGDKEPGQGAGQHTDAGEPVGQGRGHGALQGVEGPSRPSTPRAGTENGKEPPPVLGR